MTKYTSRQQRQSQLPEYIQEFLKEFNKNPINSGFGGFAVLFEGLGPLLSALVQLVPDYVIDPHDTDLPSLMTAIFEAKPQWFPRDDAWHGEAYGVIKMRLIEHEVALDLIDEVAALNWMQNNDVSRITVSELKAALDAAGLSPQRLDYTAEELLAMPLVERHRIMAAQATAAVPLYETDLALPEEERELTAFTSLNTDLFLEPAEYLQVQETVAR